MDPRLWGKGFWMIIWCILYDDEKFPTLCEVKEYLNLICRTLPCNMCRNHVLGNMTKYDIMSKGNRATNILEEKKARDDIIEFFIAVYLTSSGNKLKDIAISKKYIDMEREAKSNNLLFGLDETTLR